MIKVREVSFVLAACAGLAGCSGGGSSPVPAPDTGTTLRVAQYNVKGVNQSATGGWNVDDRRQQQVALLNSISEPLDFISLEQATDTETVPHPLVTHLLGKPGWQTLGSSCYPDALQLAYDGNRWSAIHTLAEVQGVSTAVAGFGSCDRSEHGNQGRPYNMALFEKMGSPTAFRVLVVAVHMPHGQPDGWKLSQFFDDARAVAGVSTTLELQGLHIVMTGDMNEVGDTENFALFEQYFGNLHASTALDTCCSNTRPQWAAHFDRVVSNGAQRPTAEIVNGWRSVGNDEEHKPIVATLSF